MASNSSTEVIRVTILSVNGVQYTTNKNGVSAAAAEVQKVNISACVGFRSSTISPKCIAVPSSQYSTLFDNDSSSDTNILAVYSDEVVVPCDRSTNVKLHWNNIQKQNRHAPTTNAKQQHVHAHSIDEQIIPHFEIELTSSPIKNGYQSSQLPDDAIELHVCVMCTSDEKVCTDNDDDSVDYEQYHDIQPQMCYGVAHLTIPPSEAVDTRTASSSATRRLDEEVMILPIKRHSPPSSNYTNTQSKSTIQLSNDASLSVQVERRSISNHQSLRQREQYHYIESEWRRDCSAPDSVIHNDSYNINKLKNDKELGNNNGGLLSLFRRATATLTSPRNEKTERQNNMIGKVITIEIESGMESTLNRYQNNNELSTSRPKKPKDKQATLDELDIPTQTLSERFLCGATIPITSLKEALKMAANAGHHCDEDHVGLYVVDSDDSLGTSIAT